VFTWLQRTAPAPSGCTLAAQHPPPTVTVCLASANVDYGGRNGREARGRPKCVSMQPCHATQNAHFFFNPLACLLMSNGAKAQHPQSHTCRWAPIPDLQSGPCSIAPIMMLVAVGADVRCHVRHLANRPHKFHRLHHACRVSGVPVSRVHARTIRIPLRSSCS
jgi:hypothetical protein